MDRSLTDLTPEERFQLELELSIDAWNDSVAAEIEEAGGIVQEAAGGVLEPGLELPAGAASQLLEALDEAVNRRALVARRPVIGDEPQGIPFGGRGFLGQACRFT